ncbi:MAG: hypothetical protein AAF664_13530 [Planctomycetota bacterium]
MTEISESPSTKDRLSYREYRAPRDNDQSVEFPPRHRWARLLESNRARLATDASRWQSIRSKARTQMHQDALRYTKSYRDVDERLSQYDADQPIVAAGHQPTIFHPGVWFKNFALNDLAKAQSSLAINVVVDNDVASGASIRVPTIDPGSGRIRRANVFFDIAGGGIPYEETAIVDFELFNSFDQRVGEHLRGLNSDSCVGELWKHARSAYQRCSIVSCVMAQSRHALEGDWGLQTLELPLSVLARGESFAEFASWILSDIERFSQIYNRWTLHYRRLHGIRSNAHPVPLLGERDGWREAPFWIYDSENTQRRGVWIRRQGQEVLLADVPDDSSILMRLSGQDDLLSSGLVERLGLASGRGGMTRLSGGETPRLKFRPRALVTTMYLRWVLSDLFLHGIGGGKYDQLGDQIANEFFNASAPEYAVLSATVALNAAGDDAPEDELRSLHRRLRDVRYQPERFADRIDLPKESVRRKLELIADSHLSDRADWYREIDQANLKLSRSLEELRSKTLERITEVKRKMADQRNLVSREHPFCIFSRDRLQSSFESMLVN